MTEKIRAILGDDVIRNDDSAVQLDEFCGEGRVIGLLFSGHWCRPCREFTPKLVEFYKKLKGDANRHFEVVYISCDRGEKEFYAYFKEMPWLALPFGVDEANKVS